MAQLIRGLRAEHVAANLERVRERISAVGRDPATVEILAAVKYVAAEELGALAEAGVRVVGENRAQEVVAKQDAGWRDSFTWDFIGALQSRKVPLLLPRVRYIHSLATDSALSQLARAGAAGDGARVLVEVNVAREPGKAGLDPDELPAFLERCPVEAVGLMTMPPLAVAPEGNRRHFAALRELAEHHGLSELSMGTSQDFEVAVAEGATIVRLGTYLYGPPAP